MAGEVGFERAFAVLVVTPEFFLPIRRLAAHYHARAAGVAAAGSRSEVLDRMAAPADPEQEQAAPAAGIVRELRLENVSRRYEGRTKAALDGFSLMFPRTRSSRWLGHRARRVHPASDPRAGPGPQNGRITAGGVSIGSWGNAWRGQIAWVPQHPRLFYGTVADNFGWAGRTPVTGEMVAAAGVARGPYGLYRAPAAGIRHHAGGARWLLASAAAKSVAGDRARPRDATAAVTPGRSDLAARHGHRRRGGVGNCRAAENHGYCGSGRARHLVRGGQLRDRVRPGRAQEWSRWRLRVDHATAWRMLRLGRPVSGSGWLALSVALGFLVLASSVSLAATSASLIRVPRSQAIPPSSPWPSRAYGCPRHPAGRMPLRRTSRQPCGRVQPSHTGEDVVLRLGRTTRACRAQPVPHR